MVRFLAGELVKGDGGRVNTLTCVGLYHWAPVCLGGGLLRPQDLKSSLFFPNRISNTEYHDYFGFNH